MNLNQFYVSQSTSTTTAPMKVMPRKNLVAVEVPVMSAIHLRHKDFFVCCPNDGDEDYDNVDEKQKGKRNLMINSPDQSLLVMLAIQASKAQTKTNLMFQQEEDQDQQQNQIDSSSSSISLSKCPYHSHLPQDEDKEQLIPDEYKRKVRSIVGFLPLLKKSEEVPPSPSPHLSPASSRHTSNLFPPVLIKTRPERAP